jgi:hypothetical protein
MGYHRSYGGRRAGGWSPSSTAGACTGLVGAVAALLVPLAVAPGGAAVAGPDSAGRAARAGVITTVAGGVGGPAHGPRVALNGPCGVASSGKTVFVTESAANLLRSLNPASGTLRTVAGTATTGLDSLSQPKTTLNAPCSVAVDKAGNQVIANTGSNVVQVVAAKSGTFYGIRMRAGHRYVVAGGGSTHGTGATETTLSGLTAVAADGHGNLLLATGTTYQPSGDEPGPGSAVLEVVAGSAGDMYGVSMVPGGLYQIAGDGCPGAQDAGCPPAFAGDGGPAVGASFGASLTGIAADAAGNVLLTDSGNDRVRVIAAATGVSYGQAMTAGDIYTIAGGGTGGLGDGGPATHAALSSPGGVSLDPHGNVVVSDTGDQRVRVVAATGGRFYGQAMTAGDIYTIAGNGTGGLSGNGGPGTAAELRGPQDAAPDPHGNIVIVDALNNRIRVVAATTGTFYRQRMTRGHIYPVAGNGKLSYSGDGGLATRAQLSPFAGVVSDGSGGDQLDPGSLAVSHAGDIVVADSANNRVRLVAARSRTMFGQRMTARHIYTIAGTGASGFSGDGGPATKARLSGPVGVAVDHSGNVLVSDAGNERVRLLSVTSGKFYGRRTTAGHIYTLAGGGTSAASGIPATEAMLDPLGLAVDSHGNILIADFTDLRVVAGRSGTFYGQRMRAGRIYTVKGVAAGQPDFLEPLAVAVDHAGNVVVADDLASVVQVLAASSGRFYGRRMLAGRYYTVAGNYHAGPGLSGDGGPATAARLSHPGAVAVDRAGNLLIADTINARVRVVARRGGTFYGKRMTAGHIYTVAGSGPTYFDGDFGGFSGDGGPAVKAVLFGPCGVAALGKGLVVLDNRNNRVRAVSG